MGYNPLATVFAICCLTSIANSTLAQEYTADQLGTQIEIDGQAVIDNPTLANQLMLPSSDLLQRVRVKPLSSAALGSQSAALICGLPGDEEHRQRLTTAVRQFVENAPQRLGIRSDRIRVLAGDESMVADLEDLVTSKVSTKENITEMFQEMRDQLSGEDAKWVFIFGHGNLSRKSSFLNIEGPDMDQNEFADLWKKLPGKIKIAWLMQPTSGFWIRALSEKSSVVVSATNVGLEITGTEMPYAFSDMLAGNAQHQTLTDLDQDGYTTLLDLYLATCLEVAARFVEMDRIQTEHALLEDNADGRGKELQRDYLPGAREGVLSIKHRIIPFGRDGGLARLIPVSEPTGVKQAKNVQQSNNAGARSTNTDTAAGS